MENKIETNSKYRRETTINILDSKTLCLNWFLHGEKKTTQFVVHISYDKFPVDNSIIESCQSYVVDLGYHADEEQYKGQKQIKCCVRSGGKCYYDGTSLGAYDLWKKFRETGNEELIWKELEELIE